MAMLGDIKVLELSGHVSAAFAGKLFAALGAEVVKAEPSPAGDSTRSAGTADDPVSALYLFLNTGKRATTLNLAHERGRELLHRLLSTFDVLLVDTPTLSAEHGTRLDLAELTARHPHLVVVATSPFGASGPYRDFAGTEQTIFHAGGEGYLLGAGLSRERFPDRPPPGAGGHLAGYQTGVTAAIGGLAALLDRDHTGLGQLVDVSGQDAQIAVNHLPLMRWADGVLETTANRGFTFGGVMPCADGYVEVLPLEEHQWQGLVALMGDPEWAADPRFRTGKDRGRNGAALNALLRDWMSTRTRAELVELSRTSTCPIAPYYDLDEAMNSPHAQERRSFQEITHPVAGRGRYPRIPFRLGLELMHIDERPAPGHGEHTEQVYGEHLGLSAADVAELRSVGAL